MNGALMNLRKLHMSIFDMMAHEPESYEAIQNMNFAAEYSKLRKDLLQMDEPDAWMRATNGIMGTQVLAT